MFEYCGKSFYYYSKMRWNIGRKAVSLKKKRASHSGPVLEARVDTKVRASLFIMGAVNLPRTTWPIMLS